MKFGFADSWKKLEKYNNIMDNIILKLEKSSTFLRNFFPSINLFFEELRPEFNFD